MASRRLHDSNIDNTGDFIGELAVTQSCEPCMKNNESKTAMVLCKDCNEFLCYACKNPHTVYKAGKHNFVNLQDNTPAPVILDMKGMDICHEHGRQIVFYCQDHSKLCCLSCVLIHRKCDQLDEIAKVSRTTRPDLQALQPSRAPPADASFAQSKIPRTQGFTKGKGDDAKYAFIMGRLTVYVYKKSITELDKIDVIVNAANSHLAHGAGDAYYIAKAAGKKINGECQRFISQNKKVNVTENFVSGAGDLKYKAIIHAVGPQWYDYDDRRDAWSRDLHKTVINSLEVAERRKK